MFIPSVSHTSLHASERSCSVASAALLPSEMYGPIRWLNPRSTCSSCISLLRLLRSTRSRHGHCSCSTALLAQLQREITEIPLHLLNSILNLLHLIALLREISQFLQNSQQLLLHILLISFLLRFNRRERASDSIVSAKSTKCVERSVDVRLLSLPNICSRIDLIPKFCTYAQIHRGLRCAYFGSAKF
ncbi:hypothetical protein PMAYCL1PPCAC_01274, partial [Pristionchus mayeri]